MNDALRSSGKRLLGVSALTAAVLVAVAAFVGIGNAAPSGSATPAQEQYAPKNSTPPTISGNAVVGQVLTAQAGTYEGTPPITYRYQWRRCDTNGDNCLNIGGATFKRYTVRSADIGHTLRVVVTASNADGSTNATSAATAVVPAVATGGGGGNGGGSGPVAATSVTLPDRLVIDGVTFTPNPVTSRSQTITARFHVSEVGHGRSVSGALVYAIGLPYGRIQNAGETPTDANGYATLHLVPTRKFPIVRGGALVIFLRARVPGQNLLAGASSRRLVQLNVTTP